MVLVQLQCYYLSGCGQILTTGLKCNAAARISLHSTRRQRCLKLMLSMSHRLSPEKKSLLAIIEHVASRGSRVKKYLWNR